MDILARLALGLTLWCAIRRPWFSVPLHPRQSPNSCPRCSNALSARLLATFGPHSIHTCNRDGAPGCGYSWRQQL